MNKTELINSVAEKTGVTKAVTHAVIDSTLDTIMASTAAGEEVSLVGFGIFECKTRKPRTVRSPKTGEPVQVPAKKAVTFRPGKSLKEAVNSGN